MKRFLIALAYIFVLCAPAYAVSCDDVRSYVATHSRIEIAAASAMATPDERAQAKKCLNSQPGVAHSTPTCTGSQCQTAQTQRRPVKPTKETPRTENPKVTPIAAEPGGARAPNEGHADHAAPGHVVPLPKINPAAIINASSHPQEVPMSSLPLVMPVLAVFGALAFTFVVGKYGLVPVYQKVVGWFNAGKADFAALEARVRALEGQTVAPSTGPVASAQAPKAAAHPTGTTGPAS